MHGNLHGNSLVSLILVGLLKVGIMFSGLIKSLILETVHYKHNIWRNSKSKISTGNFTYTHSSSSESCE